MKCPKIIKNYMLRSDTEFIVLDFFYLQLRSHLHTILLGYMDTLILMSLDLNDEWASSYTTHTLTLFSNSSAYITLLL